jgi:diguanylate cyclase (GGDEF)-like protein/PAS domain S-box-containing protein
MRFDLEIESSGNMTDPAATILIVDDDSDLRALLETLLRSRGYVTRTAANGEEALASVAQHAPDLILLDILMPGMDGNEVARRLKANPATTNIPIVIVTVQLDREARLEGLNAGAEDFLTKPIDRDELWLRVRNLLRIKKLGDFQRQHNSTLEQEIRARTVDLQRFRAAMDVSPDSIYLTDPASMRFVYVNNAACERLGHSHERLLQMSPQDVLAVGSEQIGREYDDVIAAGGRGLIHVRQFLRNDGTEGWTELHRRALRTEDGTLIVTIGRDITDRKRADERIRRLNRVYAVLSGITSAIVRTRSREELFRESCRIAVAEGEFVLARVIEFGSNGQARIAATSEADSRLFQHIVDEYNGNPEQSQSMLALALRSDQPLVSNDVANDLRIPNRAALTKDGNYALALLPIILDKRVVGTFLLRARDAGMFDEEELRLLLDMVSDMSFALENISKEERLNYLAMYDQLTGLANRTLFLDRLSQFIQAANPAGNKVALVTFDIVRLRTINESLGRPAGDAVIRETAERFAREVGRAEVARIGADQFAVVLQAVKGKSAVVRRLDALWQKCFAGSFRVSGADLKIAAKAGIALFPADGTEAELLLRNAEAALVRAKKLGEQHVFYTSALTARRASS